MAKNDVYNNIYRDKYHVRYNEILLKRIDKI